MDDQANSTSIPIPLAGSRLSGLEELRALAAVLVVGLHAGMPYVRTPMEKVPWPVGDHHPSTAVDCIFWCIEAFIMPLFFILSGWSSAGLAQKKGPGAFALDRSRRVLVPMLVAVAVILPMMLYIWAAGWVIYLGFPVEKLRSLNFDELTNGDFWGLGHLWYLEYLFVYCLVFATTRWYFGRAASPVLPSLQRRPLLMLGGWILAGGLVLAWDPRIVLGVYQTILPVPSKLIYYSLYFVTGIVLHGSVRLQDLLMRRAKWFIPIALLAFWIAYPPIAVRLKPGFSEVDRALLAMGLVLFAIFTALAFFGTFLARRGPAHPWALRLAEASLWIYLVHMPTVGLLHVDLGAWSGAAGLKFVVVWATSVALSWLTFESLVRTTWVGRLLHGERRLAQRPVLSITTLRTMLKISRSRAA
jgi:glucans biosynthesis protein C